MLTVRVGMAGTYHSQTRLAIRSRAGQRLLERVHQRPELPRAVVPHTVDEERRRAVHAAAKAGWRRRAATHPPARLDVRTACRASPRTAPARRRLRRLPPHAAHEDAPL